MDGGVLIVGNVYCGVICGCEKKGLMLWFGDQLGDHDTCGEVIQLVGDFIQLVVACVEHHIGSNSGSMVVFPPNILQITGCNSSILHLMICLQRRETSPLLSLTFNRR